MIGDTALTSQLNEIALKTENRAKSLGLDFFTTVFEVVDYKQLNEIAAYGGFPTRYPHWRWGMNYEKLSKSYTYGLSVIYEMVINNDPCYAYLLHSNSLVHQKTVMAHVYGHCDFFKNNYWFSKTDRKMLDKMANHATTVRRLIDEIGHDEVENFIDICLSLENLIDLHAPFRVQSPELNEEQIDKLTKEPVAKLASKGYMDDYVNPKDFLEQQRERSVHKANQSRAFPPEPVRDILKFLLSYAPMPSWQKKILSMIRDEAYYFAPQGQTKILNEGWATYWHSKMMTESDTRLEASEIVDYCDHYAGVVANHPGQLNPYRLGVELLRHIERRWDKGQYGLEYLDCDDPKVRKNWDKKTGKGREKIFEVRKHHNDVTFIDDFLDEDFCHQTKMFLYDMDPRTGRNVITSRDFRSIKKELISQITNFGQPIIEIEDANFRNRGELLLVHRHEGVDLQQTFATEVIKNIYKIWKRPVYVATQLEGTRRRLGFDGESHSVDKIS